MIQIYNVKNSYATENPDYINICTFHEAILDQYPIINVP